MSNSPWQVCIPGKAPNVLLCEFILSGSPALWGNLILCNVSKNFSAGTKPPFHQLPTYYCVLMSCQFFSTFVVHVGLSNLRSPHTSHHPCLLYLFQLDHVPPGGKMVPSGCWMEANPGFPQGHIDIFCSVLHSVSNNFFQVLDGDSPEAELQRQRIASFWESPSFNTKLFAKYHVWAQLTTIVLFYTRYRVAAKIRFHFTDMKPFYTVTVGPEGTAPGLGHCAVPTDNPPPRAINAWRPQVSRFKAPSWLRNKSRVLCSQKVN